MSQQHRLNHFSISSFRQTLHFCELLESNTNMLYGWIFSLNTYCSKHQNMEIQLQCRYHQNTAR